MSTYTNEKNIQMLIYMLKQNNIKKVIVNPGTMNMSFVASIQTDPFFELFSCVDERSACYMACGLSVDSNEPVVLTCTGATASRNYMPGLTEAFYRKIPILAITGTPHLGNVGQNVPQVLDRSNQLNDTFKYSCYISPIKCADDEWKDTVLINKAMIELRKNGGGPVLINFGTELTRKFNQTSLPSFRMIRRITLDDDLPSLDNKKSIGIFVGNHRIWSKELTSVVDEFCEKYNAVVVCDHTSNYFGKYKVLISLISEQDNYKSPLNNFDLLIHIGDTSGAYIKTNPNDVWRVNPDGEIRDAFKKLSYVFEMSELDFFKGYNSFVSNSTDCSFYKSWDKELKEFRGLQASLNLPFSNPWIASQTLKLLPKDHVLHLAILNTLRSWNYYENPNNIKCFCNTGGFGIDGIVSTLIGASFNDKDHNYYGIVGDLAFFYDMNSLGNRYVSNNLRIMLINNGCGTEFHNYSHPASVIGDDNISNFIAANGHFGNKSKDLVKNYAENLGFEYISASNKEEFSNNIDYFVDKKIYEKPVIFEVFTNSKDESDAIHQMRLLKVDKTEELKCKIKKFLPNDLKTKIKGFIKKV